MFTGLVQGIGRVKERQVSSNTGLTIAWKAANDLRLGDSIAVNGVCLTATRLVSDGFTADIMPETWQRTNLALLRVGDYVNLEPALKAGDPLGGHQVSGHVDGMVRVQQLRRRANAIELHMAISDSLGGLLVDRGSVALNGVSLTIQGIAPASFWVALIPHTYRHTNLCRLRIGDWVNIEADAAVKAVKQTVSEKTGITRETLQRFGF